MTQPTPIPNPSLHMKVIKIEGLYLITAPWLVAPVSAATFEEAYDKALRLRWRR